MTDQNRIIRSGDQFTCRRCGSRITVGRVATFAEAIKHICIGARQFAPSVKPDGSPIGSDWY